MDFKSLVSKFTIYQYMVAFLIVLNLVSAFFYDFGIKALLPVAIAVFTATFLDLLIEYFKSKTWEFPQSALISGLFIGGLLTQNLQWHIYVLAGAIAILSKHLIKFRQKHVFNPANFGVLLVSLIFGAAHTWWVSSPLILVLVFGIFIIWRLRRLDLALSFLISYYLINSIIELSKGAQFPEIYSTIINGGVIYFFSMFMLIEPKTNPSKNRVAYGMLVAVLFIIFGFFIPQHGLPLALAVGNVFVPVMDKLNLGFKKKEAKPSISEAVKVESY